jgi:hypothetical protein
MPVDETIVRLSEEVNRVIGPRTFEDELRKREADLRDWMAKVVIPVFLWANGLTLGAIALLVGLDEVNIGLDWIAPGDRIISAQVIMAMLGATTVQVGAIAVLIARYLFPGRPS